jgi:uncharacterized OsmC-like protein
MLTLMGIAGNTHGIDISGTEVDIKKHMTTNPRRIIKIDVIITFHNKTYTDKEKTILERAAHTCPVAMSLNPEIEQAVEFRW